MKRQRIELCYKGVYYLFYKGKLQYIGQSKNVYARIRGHAVEKILFDCAEFVPLPKHTNHGRKRFEHKEIRRLSPPLNRRSRKTRRAAVITNLKKIISESGLKQKHIAEKLDIDSTLMSKYVTGDRVMPRSLIKELAKLLGVSQKSITSKLA